MTLHDEELAKQGKCPCWVCQEFYERCSHSTYCNYCALERIRERAKQRHKAVTYMTSPFVMGGFDIYVHPRGINVRLMKPEQRKLYWFTWMLAIGSRCSCRKDSM